MFRRDFMPRTNNAPLEQREGRLNGIGVNIAVSVFAGVINRAVLAAVEFINRPRVDCGLIRHNHFHVAADVGVDNLSHGSGLGILGANQAEVAIALANADNNRLVTSWPPPTRFPAYIGFIYFHDSAKLLLRRLQHGRSDAVAEVPRSFIADFKLALHLIGRHTLARLAKQIRRKEPLPERQVGIVEDRSSGGAKLVAASIAVKLIALDNAANLVGLARRADNSHRPAKFLDIGAAFRLVAKVLNQSTKV